MAKMGSITRKQLRALIAVLVAMCVVLPGLIVGIHIHAETLNSNVAQKESEEVYTHKEVTPIEGEDGKYHVRIDSYATKASLEMVKASTVLVLERSEKMGETLYYRDYENLKTQTGFKKVEFEDIVYNDLYDPSNNHNIYGITSGWTSDYKDNKYIEDPNNPGTYVYVACRYESRGANAYYTLYFTDSFGNEYVSDTKSGLIAVFALTHPSSFTFTLNKNNSGREDLVPSFSCDSLWKRTDDYAKCDTIVEQLGTPIGIPNTTRTQVSHDEYSYRDGLSRYTSTTTITETWVTKEYPEKLYIKNDDGKLIPVTVTIEEYTREETYPFKNNNSDIREVPRHDGLDRNYSYTTNYTFTAKDIYNNDKQYTAVQGNTEYGLGNAIFQGFKQYLKNPDGSLVLDANGEPAIDHENSLEYRTLYRYAENTAVTRMTALQEACEDFIISLHKKAYDNEQVGYQRVGVVSYASNREGLELTQEDKDKISRKDYPLSDVYYDSNIDPMIQSIYALQPSGRRRLDVGLAQAKGLLDNNVGPDGAYSLGRYDTDAVKEKNVAAGIDENVNVIAFTAGVCSDKVNGDFKVDFANNAIENANAIEQKYSKAKIYTVGMFYNADESQTYGNWFYRTTHANIPCDGTRNSYWGGTATSGWTNEEMDEKDTAAMNRLLNYVSSNYTAATSMDVTRGYINPPGWSFGGTGYTITADPVAGTSGYYYAAPNGAEDLANAFDSIAEQIVIPNAMLNENTSLIDTLTPQFTGISNIEAYTSTYNGTGSLEDNNNWSDNIEDALDTSSSTTNQAVATGFNYGENFATEGGTGKKAVLEFDIETIDGFLGGHGVPTNGTDSGFYSADDTLIENFNRPLQNIDPEPSVTKHDLKMYRATHADLREAFEPLEPDEQGVINEYVDVAYIVRDPDGNEVFRYTIPAGETEGQYSLNGEDVSKYYVSGLDDTSDYTVECVMTTKSDDQAFTSHQEEGDNIVTIFVYNPVIHVEDDRLEYAQAVNPGANIKPEITWKASVPDGKTEPEGLPEGNAPTVSYVIKDLTKESNVPSTEEEHYSMNRTTDFQVINVVVKGENWHYLADRAYYKLANTQDDWVLVSAYEQNPSAYTLEMRDIVETYEDEDGNVTTTVIGQEPVSKVVKNEQVPVSNSDEADDPVKTFTTYITTDLEGNVDPSRDEGQFTVYTGVPYKLHVVKQFNGPLAVPEGVRFVVSDGSTSLQPIDITDFVRLKGEASTDLDLMSDVDYTIQEVMLNPETERVYVATAEKKLGDSVVQLTENAETADIIDFDFKVTSAELGSSNQKVLTITITNVDQTELPPVTGMSDNDRFHVNPYFIAAAAITILGGSGTAYLVKRKREIE